MKNKIIYSLFAILIVACFVFYAILSKDKKYSGVTYDIEYFSDTLFTEKDLAQYAHLSVIGKPFDSVNLAALETQIETFPYISNADVINNRGNLIIKATQEKVIARIFNNKDEQFLLAESGKLVPKAKNKAGRMLVISGNIHERYADNYFVYAKDTVHKNQPNIKYSPLHLAWKIAFFIEQSPFFKAQISQIYVNESRDLELVPVVGEHIILFGNVVMNENIDEVIEERFDNLKYIYSEGFKITGWKYKSINLKYGREIIPCVRNSD